MFLFDLINIWEPGFTTKQAKVHLARPNDIEHPLDVFLRGEFEEWQRWQTRNYFNRPYVVSLVQAGHPTRWLFAGLYRPLSATFEPKTKDESAHYWYDLERLSSADEWIGRLYLRSKYTQRNSWLTGERLENDLIVTELLPERLSIGQFPGYKQVSLSKEHLDVIVRQNTESWRAALAAVKGIYLITDTTTGKLYVGKADGADGIWGRWCAYANNGHGHNVALMREFGIDAPPHRKNDLLFSVLEIADLGATDIDQREAHWKRLLNSKDFGYNRN